MVSLTALRQHPRFGRFFEVVHPFFWPVIWWTLNVVFREYDASNRTEFLLGITWWGQVYIAFEGDLRPDPLTYRPIPRTFRTLTDASWASDLPDRVFLTQQIWIEEGNQSASSIKTESQLGVHFGPVDVSLGYREEMGG
jgi:hypothetical protein